MNRSQLPLFPESASSIAPEVDALFWAWTLVSLFFTALIAILIIYFMARYRRRHEDQVGQPERAPIWLEIAWSAIPLAIALAMFAWGTQVFVKIYRPPSDAVSLDSGRRLDASADTASWRPAPPSTRSGRSAAALKTARL